MMKGKTIEINEINETNYKNNTKDQLTWVFFKKDKVEIPEWRTKTTWSSQ